MRVQSLTTAAAVTPHDTNANAFVMLYVGSSGSVVIETVDGDSVTFANVPTGQYIFCQTAKVLATGTTATSIVGLK